MPAPVVTDLPDPPLRTEDSATFSAKAEAFVAALVDFVPEINALGAYLQALESGTLSALLAAIDGAGSSANKLPYYTGSNAVALADLTAAGRALIAAADAAAQRAALSVYSQAQVDTLVTGLLELKGSQDCSANPNYPAASKGDSYVVSVSGKIGGASGATVSAGDVFFATADNAGGTQASVGSSWDVIVHSGGTGSAITAKDEGSTLTTGVTSLDFTGTGVSATNTGGAVTVNIPSGGSAANDLFDMSAGVPAASAFTNENFLSGTAKGEVSGKAVFMTGTAAGNGSIQLIYKAVPASTPYRVAILVQPNFICDSSPDSWPMFGWRDSTGKLHGLLNVGDTWNTQKYNSATSFNSQDSSRVFYDHRGMYWIGLRDNGTNAYWEISSDGVNFAEIFNVTKSGSFLGSSGFNNIFIGARPNDVQAWSLTVRCYDENGITRTFP